jgi:UDP-sulfoquinovose synthase
MKILILGIDGYIGWPLALHLLNLGHEIYGLDNYSRRTRVEDLVGSNSLTPISSPHERRIILRQYGNFKDEIARFTLGDFVPTALSNMLKEFQPECIVHLAEQPSASFSMYSSNWSSSTQHQNVIGTLHLLWAMKEECPNAHLVKLGSMGEYGTPECDIPEGVIPKECIRGNWNPPVDCPMSGLLFPRSPGSFYHLSKVHDTHNIIFACKTWNLRSTDIMQGVVFGLGNHADYVGSKDGTKLITRFDYDEHFGTVINRFCAQAIIEHPLTVYGEGNQTRGFLPLQDSIQCITLAIHNPPSIGEYRTFNQFENIYSIENLASMVYAEAQILGLFPLIEHLENPRTELPKHYYNPAHEKLFNLGYEPTVNIQEEIAKLIKQLIPFKDRIFTDSIMPTTTWK